uniref:Uncharacterized protein n=1 Tax=Ascaris lumbricoides TaxID=6252 RepID=A0A0M3I319_ASCLU
MQHKYATFLPPLRARISNLDELIIDVYGGCALIETRFGGGGRQAVAVGRVDAVSRCGSRILGEFLCERVFVAHLLCWLRRDSLHGVTLQPSPRAPQPPNETSSTPIYASRPASTLISPLLT